MSAAAVRSPVDEAPAAGYTQPTVKYLTDRHADRPADDPIFALNREATQRRAAGESIVNATVGALLEDNGTLAVLPSVVQALHGVLPARGAAYAPIAGAPDFLAAVVDDMVGGTSLASRATAVATPGGSGALRHAVSTFLDRGQTLVTSSFYWGPYTTIADEHERTVTTFPMFDAKGGFDVAALSRTLDDVAARQGRVLLFLNDPCHNPTGYSLDDAEWTAIASVLRTVAHRVPLVVLCDVAYRAYARNPTGFLRHVDALADDALILFAWSASKSFAQYGLRVGALVACTGDSSQRSAVQRALSFASRGTWSNCNAAGMAAITQCLTDPSTRAQVGRERSRLTTLLDARVQAFNRAAAGTSLRYPRYDGGFFVTVFVPEAARAAEDLKSRGVFVVPQPGAVRVALCSVAEADIPRLVHELDTAVRAAT